MDVIEQNRSLTWLVKTPHMQEFRVAFIGGLEPSNRDWSFKGLYMPNYDQDLALDLGRQMYVNGAERVLAPTPGFNAELVMPYELTTFVPLIDSPSRLVAYRNSSIKADVCMFDVVGDAGVFSCGGCPIVLVVDPYHALFMHAGEKSMLDPARVTGHGQPRRHSSVADTAIHTLRTLSGHKFHESAVNVYMYGSIDSNELFHDLDHKDHRSYNEALAAYGETRFNDNAVFQDGHRVHLDLPKILQQQFFELNVPYQNIHVGDAYLDRGLPHTRNGGGTKRYVAALIRTR